MAKKTTKTTFKKGDVVLHKEQNKMFKVETVGTYAKGKLFTLAELSTKGEVEYKRYYADKLADTCTKLKNTKATKVLFAKK